MEIIKLEINQKFYPVLLLPGRPPALLDVTVAEIYGVETKRINEAVKNNPEKFPDDFCFQLTEQEYFEVIEALDVVENFDHIKSLKYSKIYPKAFTAFGCNMLPTILRSEIAVRYAVEIIRAFTLMKERAGYNPSADLRDLRELVLAHGRMIAAINQQHLELKWCTEREIKPAIAALEKRLWAVEERVSISAGKARAIFPETAQLLKQTGLESISPEQILLLKKTARKKEMVLSLWKAFRRAFGVKRYIHLPKERFAEALAWIEDWETEDL